MQLRQAGHIAQRQAVHFQQGQQTVAVQAHDGGIVQLGQLLLVHGHEAVDVDLVAGLVGGLGLTPGANIGKDAAIFEAVHGTAPDIAGKGIANPTAVMLAGCQLLDHAGMGALATKVRGAIEATLREGKALTGDLGGMATTRAYTDAVIAHL